MHECAHHRAKQQQPVQHGIKNVVIELKLNRQRLYGMNSFLSLSTIAIFLHGCFSRYLSLSLADGVFVWFDCCCIYLFGVRKFNKSIIGFNAESMIAVQG